MKRWMIGAVLGACVGVGLYLVFTKKAAPAPEPLTAPKAAAAAPTPAPVVLTRVVEVADLDPLLDPPARPVTGTPFEADAGTVPVSAPRAPERIPAAKD